MATDSGIGSDVQRREDRRVLLGESKGTDDINVSDALHIQFIRSQKAHARFSIDAETAREMNDVVEVFTPEDIKQCETSTPLPFRLFAAPMPGLDYPDKALWQRCFADKKHIITERSSVSS